ncbi:hypothetical protein ACOSP7_023417 [Xanthoceras sorbifolium]
MASSTIEAEYMVATQACKESIWIKRLMEELGNKQEKIPLFCDSQSALHIARIPTFSFQDKALLLHFSQISTLVAVYCFHIQDPNSGIKFSFMLRNSFLKPQNYISVSENNFRVGSESSQVGAELTEPLNLLTEPLTEPPSPSMGEVANLLQRSRKEASVVEVEAEAEDEVEVVVMDEVGILTAATSTTTRKEKAQQEAVGEAIQTRGTINLKEEPSLTIEVRVSSSSAIPLIQKVTSYTTRTTKSL